MRSTPFFLHQASRTEIFRIQADGSFQPGPGWDTILDGHAKQLFHRLARATGALVKTQAAEIERLRAEVTRERTFKESYLKSLDQVLDDLGPQ